MPNKEVPTIVSGTTRHPFVTGSRAYGSPRPDSDIDLVIRCGPVVRNMLLATLPAGDSQPGEHTGCDSVKAGALNLLLCTTDAAYDEWRRGTDLLIAEAPVPRERAVAVFSKLRRQRTGVLGSKSSAAEAEALPTLDRQE